MPKSIKSFAEGYIARCGYIIADKLDIGDPSTWSHAEYQELHEAIWREGRIRVSINTLKRVFGKMSTDEYYVPHSATLDALAVFLGYESWEYFKSKNPCAEDSAEIDPQIKNINQITSQPAVGIWNKIVHYRFYFFAILIIFWGSFAFYCWEKRAATNYKAVRLVCKKTQGKIFHSTAFNLVFPPGFNDTASFTLEFNDRTSEKMNLQRRNVSHYYHTPGWYMARLRHQGELVDSVVVLVKSDGWFAFCQKPRPAPERYWLKNFDGSIQGMSKVTNKNVFNSGVDTLRQFFLNYVNIKNTNINGDNFELVLGVKTLDHDGSPECTQFSFYVYGTRAKHYTGVIRPDCIAWADANFSEQIKTGTSADLSTLGHDLKRGGILKLRIKNKQVGFYLDDRKIYSTSYRESIGKIQGVNMFFSYTGVVSSFSLKDLDTGETF